MDKEISLRAAARLESICGGQGIFKSNCTGNCITNGCKCHKAGLKCNSRCHNKRSCTYCTNKDTPSDLIVFPPGYYTEQLELSCELNNDRHHIENYRNFMC